MIDLSTIGPIPSADLPPSALAPEPEAPLTASSGVGLGAEPLIDLGKIELTHVGEEELRTELGEAAATAEEPVLDLPLSTPEPVPDEPVIELAALAPEPEVVDEPIVDLAALAPEVSEEPVLDLEALAPEGHAAEEPVIELAALAADELVVDVATLAPDAADEPGAEEPVMEVAALAPDRDEESVMDIGSLAPAGTDETIVDLASLAPAAADETIVDLASLAPDAPAADEMVMDIAALAPERADEEPVVELAALAPDEPEDEVVELAALAPDEPEDEVVELAALAPDGPEDEVVELAALAPDEPEDEVVDLASLAPDEPVMEVAALAPESDLPALEPVVDVGSLAPEDLTEEPIFDLAMLAPAPAAATEQSASVAERAPPASLVPEQEPVFDLDALAPGAESARAPAGTGNGHMAADEAVEIGFLSPDEPEEIVIDLDALRAEAAPGDTTTSGPPPVEPVGPGRIVVDVAAVAEVMAAPAPTAESILPSLPQDAEDATEDEGAPIYTRTLAELYAAQGATKEAVSVLRRLLGDNPGDAALARRIAELEAGGPAVRMVGAEPRQESEVRELEGEEEEEVETLARDLAESGGPAHEMHSPFVWSEREPSSPEPAAGPTIKEYFDALLGWEPHEP
jgi:hypothetical protein